MSTSTKKSWLWVLSLVPVLWVSSVLAEPATIRPNAALPPISAIQADAAGAQTIISFKEGEVRLANSYSCARMCQQAVNACYNLCNGSFDKANCQQGCLNRYYICKRGC